MDRTAINRALALPRDQRIHVLPAWLDVLAEAEHADAIRRIDQFGVHLLGLSPLVAASVSARLGVERTHIEKVVDDQASAARSRGGGTGTPERIACLVLVAPRLAIADWNRIPVAALSPVMPIVPREAMLEAIPRIRTSRELAELLACSGPLFDDDGRRIARERATEITAPWRALPGHLIWQMLEDLHSPLASQLRRDAERWWITEYTERCISEIRDFASALSQQPLRGPALIAFTWELVADLRDAISMLPHRPESPAARASTKPRGIRKAPAVHEPSSPPPKPTLREDLDVVKSARGPRGGVRPTPLEELQFEGEDPVACGVEETEDDMREFFAGSAVIREWTELVAREPAREVSIGVSPEDSAAEPIVDHCLAPDTRYWLWVEVATEAVSGAIAGQRAQLPGMPSGTKLDVVLFTSDDQLRIERSCRRGQLALDCGGAAVVVSAGEPASGTPLGQRRLFFPVRTPNRPGASTVRVNVYCRGTLLQSHVVTAQVESAIRQGPEMLTRAIDYAITSRLTVEPFAAMPPPRLSILADHGPRTASHGFRFFAERDTADPAFIAEASLDGAKLTPMIEFARRALRTAAWGKPEPWRSLDEHPYRYAAPTEAQLSADLISLARHGSRLWSEALIAFGIYDHDREQLRDTIRRPGAVQLALQDGPRHVFPAALVYDHPLDSNRSDHTVCRQFLADLASGVPLDMAPCFEGNCPDLGDKRIVCPSGFWGFRHEIGVTPHLRGREIATAIGERIARSWLLVAMISTDPTLTERAPHLDALARMPELDTVVIDERQRCLAALEMYGPHISYFYCHGGVTAAGTPYLEVGPRGSDMITSDNFTELAPQEHAPRPLVVLNGCHTTATTPEQAFDLVSGFLCHANAAGVVGTEITIFEPLARAFGESLLRHFVGGATLGAAVRRARLSLLGRRNPLGLAYVPFALPELALAGQKSRPPDMGAT